MLHQFIFLFSIIWQQRPFIFRGTMRSAFFVTMILAFAICDSKGYSLSHPSKSDIGQMPAPPVSRQNFLATVAVAMTVGIFSADVSWAKDSDSAKGTKEDPIYQACLSQCKLHVLGAWHMMIGP
jgi:hypothetical protein